MFGHNAGPPLNTSVSPEKIAFFRKWQSLMDEAEMLVDPSRAESFAKWRAPLEAHYAARAGLA